VESLDQAKNDEKQTPKADKEVEVEEDLKEVE